MDPNQLAALIEQHAWVAIAAIIIGGVVRLLKSDTPIPINVKPQYRAWLALGLGVVVGVLDALVAHKPWAPALAQGLVAAFMAITGHETIVESLRKGRDLGLKKTPQGPPPPPPSSGDVALLDDALVAETRPVHVPSIRPGTSVLRKATMLQSIGYSLVGLFVVSCAGLFLASTSACSPQQWDDAADTAIEVARESACVENYLEHSADPTFEGGAVLCTGASLSLFQQIVQDFKDAHAAPIVDAGVMRVTGPSALEIGLVRLHHAEAGAQ